MSSLRFYQPQTAMLTLGDFPPEIREQAERIQFAGNGRPDAPFIMGWRVRAAGGVARNEEAKDWLRSRGFKCLGGKWCLRDDIADERALAMSKIDYGTYAVRNGRTNVVQEFKDPRQAGAAYSRVDASDEPDVVHSPPGGGARLLAYPHCGYAIGTLVKQNFSKVLPSDHSHPGDAEFCEGYRAAEAVKNDASADDALEDPAPRP